MNRADIIVLPDSRLRQRSKRVGIISEDTKKMVNNMIAATLDWEDHREHEAGVALAAVQIAEMLRVIIIRNDFENRDDRSFTAYINPEITKYEGEMEEDFEGCLSVSGIYGKVERSNLIKLKALDINGKEVRVKAEGFRARVFQHEIDHTNGTLFIDHIKDKPEAFFSLVDDGHLIKLDYEKDIQNNKTLWE